jgi:hypothetical protein
MTTTCCNGDCEAVGTEWILVESPRGGQRLWASCEDCLNLVCDYFEEDGETPVVVTDPAELVLIEIMLK